MGMNMIIIEMAALLELMGYLCILAGMLGFLGGLCLILGSLGKRRNEPS